MRPTFALTILIVTLIAASTAQIKKAADISAVAAAGGIEASRYTNSYFKMTVDAPNARLQLNPVVNAKGQYARLLQVERKPPRWEDSYTLTLSADSLTINPQVQSTVQYVRSIRHQLEREGLPTVQEEFPTTIAGVKFTGAILEERVPGRKYFRGIYSTFRNSYVLTFDIEAPSPEQLNRLLTEAVQFVSQ